MNSRPSRHEGRDALTELPAYHKARTIVTSILFLAGVTRLELATSGLTGQRSNQTELHPRILFLTTPFVVRVAFEVCNGGRNRA